MSTRGLFGFVNEKNELHAIFSSSDSYPDGLGFMTLEKLIPAGEKKDKAFLGKKLKFVDDAPEDQLLSAWELLQIGWSSRKHAYQAFESKDFMQDGLFCEWSYIYHFKENEIQCYKGSHKFLTISLTMDLKEAKLLLMQESKKAKDEW
jgi:hypothetical protein